MTVRGKVGRGVPVIMPDETKHGLTYLTDPNIRLSAGIAPGNEYIFASQGEGILWAYDSLKKACQLANLSEPTRITSTSLRKYMATVTQVLDLKDNQMQWVLNHMGHTMDVHKIHYRATSEILERTQIAKILILQDQGRVAEFKNKALDDIQLEDVVFGNGHNDFLPRAQRDTEIIDIDIEGGGDQFAPDVVEETLDEAQTFFEGLGENDVNPKKQRKSIPKGAPRNRWTMDEEAEIRQLFKRQFDAKVRPKPEACLKAIRRSRKENGLLQHRKKDVLKKKVFRMIDVLKK